MNPTSILRVFGKSTLGRRFTFITIMFLTVLLGIMVYTTMTIQKEKSNAILIDMAGRQRMLFEKHLNEVYLTSQGITADFRSTRELLRLTLDSLMKGGSVTLDPETGKSQTIPAVPTEEILLKLQEQVNHFDKVIESSNGLLMLSPDFPEFYRALKTLRAKNSIVIEIADDAVKQLARHSELNIATMVKWESMAAFLVALLGAFVTSQGIRASKKLENEIEERKKAEKKFMESEQKFRVMAETVPDILFTNQPDGSCDYVNQRLYEYTGLSPDSGLGFGGSKAIHSDDLEHSKDKWLRTVNAGLPYEDRYRLISPNGTYRWFMTRTIPVKNAKGQIEKWFGVSTDIQDLVQAEDALRATEQMYRQILDSIPDMVLVKDRNFRILWANKAFRSYYDMTNEELKGIQDSPINDPSFTKQYNKDDSYVFNTGKILDILEESVTRHDGHVAFFHTIKAPLFAESGEVVKSVGVSRDITERKKTELERAQQESLLRLVIETGPSCIKRVATDGTLLHMNTAGLKLIEAEGENEAVGLSVFDLVVPEHVDAFRHMHQKVLKGEQQTLQFEIQGFKGTRRWMETFAVPFSNPITKEMEQLAVTHDITERKATEEVIRKGERKFRAIYEQAPTGIAVLDSISGRFTQINQKYCDIMGYSPEEMLERNFQELTYPDDLQADLEHMQQLLAGQIGSFQMEKRYIRKNGQIIWVNLICVPLWLEPTDPRLHIAMVEDITHRKQAEKILQESEERYRTLYEDNPSMYFTVAQDGKILSVNQFGAQQLGYSVEGLIGQPVIGIFLEDDQPLVQEHFNDCLRNPMKLFNWELRKQKKDGKVLWVRETARAIKGQEEETVVLIVCEDITERKHTENRLRESEIKRIETLHQSDELKSALLSSVSHELRTPLTAMKGSVSSIIGKAPSNMDQEQQAFLKGIDTEIDYMSQLVNNLLDMSQIEAGTLIPHKEWHLLEDLVEGALRRTEQTLDTRDIDIHIPENVPPVFVDAVQMQQVLINLLDNAVKYSLPASPIRLNIRVEAQNIAVEASNEGEPIQLGDLERIFDRFYRRPPPRQQPIHGTGLGLAICKGIVEAHGGRIWAESIEKKVTITFTIPTTEHMASFSLEGRHKSQREL